MISNNSTPVNEFSDELWNQLASKIERALEQHQGPRIAAFDADGTLWDHDAGETFFDWEIHHAGLGNLPADPWKHYHDLKKPDPRIAYVWLAQINAGHSLAQVRKWAAQCFAQSFKDCGPWPVFKSQKRLIDFLIGKNFEIFIVTASVKWAVEPLAHLVGVNDAHVLGVETEIENGLVGLNAKMPITWREGKAEGLLKATGGIKPILACGNTYGDTHLLECASHIQLALKTQNRPGGLFEEERKLAVEAEGRGWLRHEFR
jgi:phosphoserine phosphatase